MACHRGVVMSRVRWNVWSVLGLVVVEALDAQLYSSACTQLLAAPVVRLLPPPKLPPGAAEDPRMGV
jgi:hypothetical protein